MRNLPLNQTKQKVHREVIYIMKTNSAMPISADTQRLLNHVYQGCQMGIDSMHRLLERTHDTDTKNLLLDLAHEHRRIMSLAAEAMRPYLTAPEDIGVMDKMRSRMVAMDVRRRNPDRRIAKTLILGSRMALHSLMKNLRKYPLAKNSAQQLVGELIRLEKRTMREGLKLRKYAA